MENEFVRFASVPTRPKPGPSPEIASPSVALRIEHPQGRSQARRLKARALAFLEALDLAGVELSVLLTTDAAIRSLNREWRKRDQPTDVLSFPAGPVPAGHPHRRPLGDIVLSLDTARRQAREHGQSLATELDLYLAHGLLHLLGHHHHRPGEARRMSALEDRLLGRRGMIRRSGVSPGRYAARPRVC